MKIPVGRRILDHEPPLEVSAEAIYFVTICCVPRGKNHLCRLEVRNALFKAAQHYEREGKWFMHVLLLMPDHVHFLTSPGREHTLTPLVKSWKSFTAKRAGVAWQRDWFDHRLRSDESHAEKEAYILNNPVRKGLVKDLRDWPYYTRGDSQSGTSEDACPYRIE